MAYSDDNGFRWAYLAIDRLNDCLLLQVIAHNFRIAREIIQTDLRIVASTVAAAAVVLQSIRWVRLTFQIVRRLELCRYGNFSMVA